MSADLEALLVRVLVAAVKELARDAFRAATGRRRRPTDVRNPGHDT